MRLDWRRPRAIALSSKGDIGCTNGDIARTAHSSSIIRPVAHRESVEFVLDNLVRQGLPFLLGIFLIFYVRPFWKREQQ